jgi:hypothetical protein
VAGAVTVTAAVSKSGETVNVGAELTVTSDEVVGTAGDPAFVLLSTISLDEDGKASGTVSVTVSVDRGDQTLTQVGIAVDGEIVDYQSFGGGMMMAPTDDEPAEQAGNAIFTLSFDSAEYDETGGPKYMNGDHVLTAGILVEGGGMEPILSNSVHVDFDKYSCFFLYLKQVVGFSLGQVAIFIAVLCVTSVVAQTAGLTLLMSLVGNKYCIIVGLFLQATQLVIYGISTSTWLMWVAGMLAASASIIYPAISAMVSRNAEPEQQGVVLGILTGIRGLCNGLGPALFGLLFWLSDVHLSDSSVNIDPALAGAQATDIPAKTNTTAASIPHLDKENRLFLGIPFLIGAFPVFLALLVAFCIKDKPTTIRKSPSEELIPLRETPHRHLRNSVS